MKVLFISSGNSEFGLSPIIKNQGQSLKKQGLYLENYLLNGKGLLGYIKNIIPLRRYLKQNNYDIIHAHFSLTCFVAALAGAKPLVASLMGWNVKLYKYRVPLYFFNRFFFDVCIVKSRKMKNVLNFKNIHVVPNGVNLERFYPIDKSHAQIKLNWGNDKLHILFAANPNRPIKNYPLAEEAFQILKKKYSNIELHSLEYIPNEEMIYYYNASDWNSIT